MAPPEYPVKVGSMLYTLVDPEKGHEVSYNRWYERDHFYAGCMIGPWLFAGSRWVRTRELKDLSYPQDENNKLCEPWDKGSFVAIYWVHEDHFDDHFDWAGEQVVWLYQNGRGYADRHHAHTVLYDYGQTLYRDDDPVPIELALDHGYAGLASIAFDRADGVSAEEFTSFLENEALPDLYANSSAAMCSIWTPIGRDDNTSNAPMDLGSGTGDPAVRTMQLCFLEGDPRESWDAVRDYTAKIESAGKATVAFASPFFKTVPGTDKYTDELW